MVSRNDWTFLSRLSGEGALISTIAGIEESRLQLPRTSDYFWPRMACNLVCGIKVYKSYE